MGGVLKYELFQKNNIIPNDIVVGTGEGYWGEGLVEIVVLARIQYKNLICNT